MKTIKLGLLSLLVAPMLAGCGGGSDGITLTIWEDESNLKVVAKLAQDWVDEYHIQYPLAPKITVNVTKQTEKSAIEKMGQQASTGHGPDIAAVTHDTISSGVSNKLLAPVRFADEVKERSTEKALDAVSVEEMVYAYPITAESMVLMYDAGQVDDVSKLASFESIKANNLKIGLQLTGDDGGYYSFGLYTDSVLFGENGKDPRIVDIATPNSINNVLTFYRDYVKKDESNVIYDYTPNNNLVHVKAGRIQGLVATPYMLAAMKNSLGESFKIAPLPTINGQELRPFSGYKAYVVSRYSTQGALAQELANYLTSEESQAYRLQQLGYLPACHLEGNEDIEYLIENDPNAQVFKDMLSKSILMPAIPEMSNFWIPMNNASTAFKNAGDGLTEETVRSNLDSVTNKLLGN